MSEHELNQMQDWEDRCYEDKLSPQMRDNPDCVEIRCSHWDGDMCMLGFCEPDTVEDGPKAKKLEQEEK